MGAHVPFDPEELEFLNNFFTRFRWGSVPHPQQYPQGLHRFVSERIDTNLTNRQYLQSTIGNFENEAAFNQYCSKHSERYLDQTPSAFYAEIEAVMTELGLSEDEIAEHINRELEEQVPGAGFTEDTINAPLRPIYQALRERGYNWKDLAA